MGRSAPRHLRCFALIVLTLFTCILSACSSQDRTPSANPTPTPTPTPPEVKTAPVTFVFDLLEAKGEIPAKITRFDFYGFADTECQSQIYTESVAKDKTLEGDQQKVTLDIPVEVVKVKIRYYNAPDKAVAESTTETLELKGGQPLSIVIKEAAPPQTLTAPVTFVFDLMTANGGGIPAGVSRYGFFGYSDEECKTQVYAESVGKDASKEGAQQEVTLDIPVEVIKVKICYYDNNEKVVAESTTETLELTEGESQTIYVKESAPPKGANVTLKFDRTVVVPTTTTKCQVNMFDGEDKKAISAYTAAVDPAAWADITVADVPANVAKIEILWLDSSDVSHASHRITEVPELTIGETAEVNVSGSAEMETSDLTLTLNNVWNDNSLTAANVHLVYKSECVTEDERDVTGTLSGTTCTVQADELIGLNIEVSSVTLTNQETNVPFEWLDYDTAQAASDGTLTLDVDENDYYGGSGTIDDPYLLINPRQFRNINDNPEANFKQVADIDFTGTCGITIDDNGTVFSTDSSARYYNNGAGYTPLAASTAFSGTYDGNTHDISGVAASSTAVNTALFGKGVNCTFKNVTIDDTCRITTLNHKAAALVAQLDSQDGTCSLENCKSNVALFLFGSMYPNQAGGLVAKCGQVSQPAAASFTSCAFGGTIKGLHSSYVGGIVGYACMSSGQFQSCANTGNILAGAQIGGIVGWLSSSGTKTDPISFVSCSNSTNLKCYDGYSVGGIIGKTDGCYAQLERCTHTGNLQANNYIGGLISDANDYSLRFVSCVCSGEISSTKTSSATTKTAILGSFLGSLATKNVEFAGTNYAECVFKFDTSLTQVGGAIGVTSIDEMTLKELMTDHVTVTDDCAKSVVSNQTSYRGKYCGSPWLDSL